MNAKILIISLLLFTACSAKVKEDVQVLKEDIKQEFDQKVEAVLQK